MHYEYKLKGYKLSIDDNTVTIYDTDGNAVYSDKGSNVIETILGMCDNIHMIYHGCEQYHNPELASLVRKDGFMSFILDIEDPATLNGIASSL